MDRVDFTIPTSGDVRMQPANQLGGSSAKGVTVNNPIVSVRNISPPTAVAVSPNAGTAGSKGAAPSGKR